MDFRPFLEADCGSANPLIQLSSHFSKDSAYREEGFVQHEPSSHQHSTKEMVSQFLVQANDPPQTFHMQNLIKEMKTIDTRSICQTNTKLPEIFKNKELQPNYLNWADEFKFKNQSSVFQTINEKHRGDLHLEENVSNQISLPLQYHNPMLKTTMGNHSYINHESNIFDEKVEDFFKNNDCESESSKVAENWLEDFEKTKEEEAERSESYYDKFWTKLQQDWNEMAEYDNYPWLSQTTDFDPYKEYEFFADNPMAEIENALEKGKEFLKQGDIPTAVLCFEAAVKQEPKNSEAWELLGLSQAENEMDPHAISALKQSLDLNPNNKSVIMALSVSYTNESLQSQALNMLAKWLYLHPKYSSLVPTDLSQSIDSEGLITKSLIGRTTLTQMQNLFLNAVRQYPQSVDPEIQEALGILFNLSSEYDKAVDCFQAALNSKPNSSKLWNRLGASLANGNRSIEAVEAYKRALQIQPGFIRARYNVGIICMNLKAYKEAAEHLLTALNMQANSLSRSGLPEHFASSVSPMSEVIWSTLRMVFALMGRDDLKKAANLRDLKCLNHEIKIE